MYDQIYLQSFMLNNATRKNIYDYYKLIFVMIFYAMITSFNTNRKLQQWFWIKISPKIGWNQCIQNMIRVEEVWEIES